MRLASAKDRIALQYVTDFQDIFDFSVLIYYNAASKWGDEGWAALSVYAGLLSQFPDSHIERKYGDQYSEMVVSMMSQLSNELTKTERPEYLFPLLYSMDQELKSRGVNPGTMADMTVATVLTVFLEDVIRSLRNKNLPI
jgi:triphosphoribosyl-dephospho-CoA synthase